MIYDFHTHTFFSDGINSPIELIRYAVSYGYGYIAITDHVSYSNIDFVLENVVKDCQLAQKYWDVVAIPGVEITNVPAKSIDQMAEYAKSKGAKLVVVHGQSIVERVEEGTNWEAVNSSHVDILAHPGLITEREAKTAAEMGVFLEISGRRGHSLGNGRTALKANQAGARLLINTDSHSQNDLFKQDFQRKVGLGAGLSPDEVEEIIKVNAKLMLKKIGIGSR
ncbi:MAG: histidinol phosphate phosphatase domain-containing protein [Actinomycetota bacterium]|nr:histidinol phosphate phosphatase domain-containing protein [Actinomycetota bacterium]